MTWYTPVAYGTMSISVEVGGRDSAMAMLKQRYACTALVITWEALSCQFALDQPIYAPQYLTFAGLYRCEAAALWSPDDHDRPGSRWVPHQGAHHELLPHLLPFTEEAAWLSN